MVFSSAPFLFVFLPVVFILYSCIKNLRAQNALLIIASLFFYGYGEPVFVLAMVGSVAVNYLLARRIVSRPSLRKIWLTVAVIANLAFLGIFKYAGFAVELVNGIFHLSLPIPKITLPIGISFFTFQVMSYVIDVYRDEEILQKNFFKLLLYVSFFPQLIAGPIVKYHDVYKYIEDRHQTTDEVVKGMRRFILGLSKKLFLANATGAVTDAIYALKLSDLSAPSVWLGTICYCFQIYFDFSGYSDMAIGLGHMFGFTFLENFDHPYISKSIKEYWRRWHISLSTWFKEYLYIPLGGNRKGRVRTEINKLIVFFLTGLWHGAGLTFVAWGLIHGCAVVLEDIFSYITGISEKKKNVPVFLKVIGFFWMALIVTVGFVFFRADSIGQAVDMVKIMFSGTGSGQIVINTMLRALTPYTVFMIFAAAVSSMPVISWVRKASGNALAVERIGYVLSAVLLVLCCLNIASATFNPFIYFRF